MVAVIALLLLALVALFVGGLLIAAKRNDRHELQWAEAQRQRMAARHCD